MTKVTKADKIRAILNEFPKWSDVKVAKKANSTAGYVWKLRKEFLAAVNIAEGMTEFECEQCDSIGVETKDDIDAVLAERGSRYGDFISHARITQFFKEFTYLTLRNKQKTLASDQQEALDMIFHKIGRILNGDPDYADSWIDIAGYAKLVADRLEGKVR